MTAVQSLPTWVRVDVQHSANTPSVRLAPNSGCRGPRCLPPEGRETTGWRLCGSNSWSGGCGEVLALSACDHRNQLQAKHHIIRIQVLRATFRNASSSTNNSSAAPMPAQTQPAQCTMSVCPAHEQYTRTAAFMPRHVMQSTSTIQAHYQHKHNPSAKCLCSTREVQTCTIRIPIPYWA